MSCVHRSQNKDLGIRERVIIFVLNVLVNKIVNTRRSFAVHMEGLFRRQFFDCSVYECGKVRMASILFV